MAEKFEKLGIKVRTNFLKRKKNFLNLIFYYFFLPFHLVRTLLHFKPSIIHFYLPQAYILGGFLTYLFSSKKFIMSRRSLNFYQNKYPKILKTFEIILHKKMDLIIGNSLAVCNQLKKEEKVDKKKCLLIYNGINSIVHNKSQNNTKVSILCIANFIPYKNHVMLIKACCKLPEHLNWQLILVGKDSYNLVAKLKSLVKKKSLQNKFKFLNQELNLAPLLEKSDIGVLTSDEEGFSNSILEYMNYSLPVIATNVGGNRESIFDNKNGFLIDKNNVDQLTKKLKVLITDKGLRKRMGVESKRLINKYFEIKDCIQKYKKVYTFIPYITDLKEHRFNVSVIIPHYNDSKNVEKAIISVLSQTIEVQEILVIDDGSNTQNLNNLKKLMQKLNTKKIKIFYQQHNLGACFCRNFGFNKAKSEYVALLDSDDHWMEDKLEKQISYMKKHDLDFSCTSFQLLNTFNKNLNPPKIIRYKENIKKKDLVWGCFLSPGSTAVINRNFLLQNNLFQNEKLRRLEDWHWLINIEKKTKILFLDEPLSFINVTKKPSFEMINSSVETFRKSVVKKEKKIINKIKYLSSLYLEKSSAALYSNHIALFLFYGISAFLIYPFRNLNFFSRSLSLFKFLLKTKIIRKNG